MMKLSKLLKVLIMEPAENTAIKRNEINRNRFLEKFFITPGGTPLIPK